MMNMRSLFESLCDLLENELERQENVLAVCQAQSEAVARNDIELLEAKTGALLALVQEAAQAAAERVCLIKAIIAKYIETDCPNDLKFDDIAAAAPKHLRQRLEETHARLRSVLKKTRPVALANASSLAAALRAADASLALIQTSSRSEATYDATGRSAGPVPRALTAVDQRG